MPPQTDLVPHVKTNLRFNVGEILNSRFPLLSQPQYVLIE